MNAEFLQKLKQNLFISVQMKKHIVSNWKNFSDLQKRAFGKLVAKTDKIQQALIKKAVKKNPNFYVELKFDVIKKAEKNKRKKAEANQENKEMQLEQDLLKSLNNI